MKRSIVNASSTLRPRTVSTTRRTLRGLIGMSLATARTCIFLPHVRRLASGMPPEGPCRSKFAQLVADHVLAHEDRHMATAIMHRDRMPHELREDRRGARPRADDLLLVALVERFDSAIQLGVHEGALL